MENTARVKSYGRSDREHLSKRSEDADRYGPDDAHGYTDESNDGDCLEEMFEGLEPLTQVSTEIRRCIPGIDEIADDASPELKSIRRLMKVTNDKIHSQLNSMVNNTYKSYLQDSVITMREGRYCIPVKAEYPGGADAVAETVIFNILINHKGNCEYSRFPCFLLCDFQAVAVAIFHNITQAETQDITDPQS